MTDQEASMQLDYEHAIPEESLDAGRSYAQPIQNALRKGMIARAWGLFERNYTSKDCEALTEPSPRDIQFLSDGKIFLQLLQSVNSAFCKADPNLDITPTVLLFRYEQLGLARPEYWAQQTLSYLTYQAIRAGNATADKPNRDLPSLLLELLSVWRLFFQCKGATGDPLETISTEWQLPAVESLPDMFMSRDFNTRLHEYHPKYIGNPTLGFCAVYLYSISDALNMVEVLQQQAAPFLRFLERLLASSRVDAVYKHTYGFNTFKRLPEEIQQQITREIGLAPQKALVMLGSSGETLTDGGSDAVANLEAFHLKQIARAIELKSSARVLDKLWKDVEEEYIHVQNGTIPSRIYNAFLSGYLVLHASPRSVEVWNHMIASGVMPDMKSWVALLEGCAKARDLDGFNTMWQRMLNTGLEPDNYAWTMRVNGLFSLRQVNQGLTALDEMGRRWASVETPQTHGKGKRSAKNLPTTAKAVNKCTKPSIEVVNGAISALVQIRGNFMPHDKRVGFVQKILGWARNFEIKPDVRTYNSLIQLYLSAGDHATAFKVLRQMEQNGIQSDIATATMLVTAALDNQKLSGLSHSEQTERILSILSDLESSGLKLNANIYSAAISRLLKEYNNYDAARALIHHMAARNLTPSTHVYTSVITHYFQQEPPAIVAVDSIMNLVFTSHRVPSDRILFDRLIEGYATHGEVVQMMSVLTRMSKHGKLPGWNALSAVVRALMEDGDVESAQSVVRDVQTGAGVAKGGILGDRQGEAAFFAMVREYRLGLEEKKMGDFLRQDRAVGAGDEEATQEATPPPGHQSALEYAGTKGDLGYEQREPGSVEEEEDVHGFLRDEPEHNSSYARKS
jgi:pentatricopeptide repeat protein